MASEEMMQAFLEAGGNKPKQERAQKPGMKRAEMKRTRRPRSESFHQAVREAFIAGVKAARISDAIFTQGFIECARCPRRFEDVRSALKGLQLHHNEKRSQGTGYRRGRWGVDSPHNLELLCAGRGGCHDQAESQVEWSAS